VLAERVAASASSGILRVGRDGGRCREGEVTAGWFAPGV